MKSPLLTVFIVATVMVAIAHCFPREKREREDLMEDNAGVDTVLLLPKRIRDPFAPRPLFQMPDLDDDDDDSLEGFNPFRVNFNPWRYNPLDGFLDSMQTAINTIKEQMAGVLSGIPGPGAFNPWGKIPEGGNTTSTTKIIDGHVVTVNETTYQSNGDDSSTIFRVRIVDVQPLNNQTTEGNEGSEDNGGEETETVTSGNTTTPNNQGEKEETTTPARSVETVEDLSDNKVPTKSIEDNLTA